MSDTAYYCHDTLQPFETKHTESGGALTPGIGGDFTVNSPAVAQELKERYPHMLVTPHDKYFTAGKKVTHSIMWTMPELPGTGWTRKQTEAQTGTVEPLEVNTDGKPATV